MRLVPFTIKPPAANGQAGQTVSSLDIAGKVFFVADLSPYKMRVEIQPDDGSDYITYRKGQGRLIDKGFKKLTFRATFPASAQGAVTVQLLIGDTPMLQTVVQTEPRESVMQALGQKTLHAGNADFVNVNPEFLTQAGETCRQTAVLVTNLHATDWIYVYRAPMNENPLLQALSPGLLLAAIPPATPWILETNDSLNFFAPGGNDINAIFGQRGVPHL